MQKHTFTKIVNTSLLFISLSLSSSILAEPSVNIEKKSLMEKIMGRYVQASNTNKSLKYLLDAKMELVAAEHDLLVSHNKAGAKKNIENTISSLVDAEELARPKVKDQIQVLIKHLKPLEQKTIDNKQSGLNDEVDKLLNIAQSQLLQASEHVTSSPSTKQEIEDINNDIQKLRNQIEHMNLRSDYELVMHTLDQIIKDM